MAGDTGLILIAAAKAALAVGCLPLGVKAFQLLSIAPMTAFVHCFSTMVTPPYGPAFDLQTLDKGLEAGTQLTDAAQGVLLLDGAAGDAHLLLKHVLASTFS